MRSYLEGDCDPADAELKVRQLKKYRSHRGMPPSESNPGAVKAKPWSLKIKRRHEKEMKEKADRAMRTGVGLTDETAEFDDDDDDEQLPAQ